MRPRLSRLIQSRSFAICLTDIPIQLIEQKRKCCCCFVIVVVVVFVAILRYLGLCREANYLL